VTGGSVVKSNLLAQQLMGSPGAAGSPRQVVIRQSTPGSTPTVQKIVSAGSSQMILSGAQVYTTPSGQQVILQGSGTTPTGQLVIGGRVINGQQVLIRGPNNTLMTLAGTPAQGGKMIVKTVSAATPGAQQQQQRIVQKPILVQKPAGQTPTVVTPTASGVSTPNVAASTADQTTPNQQTQPATPTKDGAVAIKPQPTPTLVTPTSSPAVGTPPSAQAGASTTPIPKLLGTPTAQVIQTPNGPSIILQGLKGNFTEQQLASLKEQVKQHVLKHQANKATGSPGSNTMVVSMPTPSAAATIVSPSAAAVATRMTTPPTTVVKSVPAPIQAAPAPTTVVVQQPQVAEQPKVVVQTVQAVQPEVKVVQPEQPPLQQVARQVLVNGQSSMQPEAPNSPPSKNDKGQFVVTPDYIQQSKFQFLFF
jgi:nucleosome-remodeling factor subunit BPTF